MHHAKKLATYRMELEQQLPEERLLEYRLRTSLPEESREASGENTRDEWVDLLVEDCRLLREFIPLVVEEHPQFRRDLKRPRFPDTNKAVYDTPVPLLRCRHDEMFTLLAPEQKEAYGFAPEGREGWSEATGWVLTQLGYWSPPPAPPPTPDLDEERAASILGTRAGRRALGLASPEWWDAYYAGMRAAPHRTRWLQSFDKAHRSKKKKRLLLLAPRGHGKTEAVATFCARAICYDRNVRILLICANEDSAKKRLQRIKRILRSPKVEEDFTQDPEEGFWGWGHNDDDRWRETMILVTRTAHHIDPTVAAVGAGGKITGGHFDVIIADDLEDDKNTATAGERAKTKRWFVGTLQPMLEPGGTEIAAATRKHYDDLYGSLKESPGWEVIQEPAILKWPTRYEVQTETQNGKEVFAGIEVEGEAEVLWRERTFEELILEREANRLGGEGVRDWNREYLHIIQDDSTAAVEIAWLEQAAQKGKSYSLYEIPTNLNLATICQGWDFSLVEDAAHAAKKDTDYTVGLTWARTRDDHRILLGIYRKRGLTQDQLLQAVEAEYDRFLGLGVRIPCVAVERNNFGRLHYAGLVRRGRLPVVPHDTTAKSKADPWVGIPGLAMLFEQGRVILPSRTRADRKAILPLQQELHGLGVERHDDCPMALHVVESVTRLQPNQAAPLPRHGSLTRNPEEQTRKSRRKRVKRIGPPAGSSKFTNLGWE